jgi:serine/threonine protein kinase
MATTRPRAAIAPIVLQAHGFSSIVKRRVVKPAQPLSRHLVPGDKLGKYELIRQVAIGGMAELYLARTSGIEGFEKLVVLKRILPQHHANQSFVNMFLNEARLAATLHHPNIAQVYDIGVDAGDYFFAMEYVHGEDLMRISSASNEQGVPMSMDAALTLATGLCAALHYAHEKLGPEGKPLHIVHRDVSPSNVIVSYDGAVKLVDFGIARAASRPGTTQGGLKGKIAYMSPEQCTSKAIIDRRSDIFSVGTLLYELTTGQLPFTGETEYQVLNQIVNDNAPPPSRLVPEYPAALEKIVMRALARDPAQRYSNALTLQGALEDFAHENRLRVSPLVLGRLMGTLFPERLEEWAQAKTQGAFFVEQHVVRTLIEAGKTPDPNDPEVRAHLAAQRAALAAAEQAAKPAVSDDDTTSVTNPPAEPGNDSTTVGPPPFVVATTDDSQRVPIPVAGPGYAAADSEPQPPPLAPPPKRPSTPAPASVRPTTPPPAPVVPNMPGAVPIVDLAASVGTMVSATITPQSGQTPLSELLQPETRPAPAGVQDVTVNVRNRRKRQRSFAVPAIVAAVAIGAAALAFVIAGGGDSAPPPAPAAAAPVASPPAVEPPPPAAEPVPPPPQPVAEPTPVAEPKPEPAPVAEKKPAAPPPKKIVHAAPPAKPHVVKPETKPAEEPKEPAKWNADSPFMPVRTEKH